MNKWCVEKRDGVKVGFDPSKIRNAIEKAMKSCGVKEAEEDSLIITDNVLYTMDKPVSTTVSDKVPEGYTRMYTVEEIQDIVEKELMRDFPDVAKAYILYRNERSRIRENKSELFQVVEEKLFATNVQNQNANMDEHSFGGRMGEVRSTILKKYALEKCMSKMSRDNHLNNEIYIHDLDSYAVGMHNCMTIPFDDLLANGFDTRNCDVRPANSVSTAFQLVAVIFQLQSLQQFGGVSASHLDWTMVPYVRKSFMKHFKNGLRYITEYSEDIIDYFEKSIDIINTSIEDNKYKVYDKVYKYALDLTTKEVCQSIEGMYHNLNTLQSRSGQW
ncbi:MAG: hypothetical protein IJ193_09845 [Bacilli bacterium]|nr:hypothetical protein [Bacilli bacterium]